MTRLTFLPFSLLFSFIAFGQTSNNLPLNNDVLQKTIAHISFDQQISADSTFAIFKGWSQYPNITDTRKWYLFLYKDTVFRTVPLRVYIPETYKSNTPSPVVLILHGAVGMSTFKDAYKDTASDEDLFYSYFSKKNFIIIRPYADSHGPNADGTINFDWVVNRFNGRNFRNKTNPTFQTLTAIITQLKQALNIDDSKVFAFGHSDGSDGVFALEVYKPSPFAGFVAYNSMLKTLGDYDIFIRNTLNRPLYLVHSDLDDLRPIQQTRLIMKVLDSLNAPVLYKEYIGYQHFDKHLQIDLPYSYEWMKGINRNPFEKSIIWEMSDSTYSTCDWLHITQFDTALQAASWHSELNTGLYNKRDKVYINDFHYYDLNKSAAIKGDYNNNVFEISTSRVKNIELFISPVMVNLQNPVIVKVNGKEVFNQKVTADKAFLLHNFTTSFDKQALWVTSIKLKTD